MKKVIRLNENDIKRMVVKILNETLGEVEFDGDYSGLEPDPEEKKAQMGKDWKDYYNPKHVEKYTDSGTPYFASYDDTDWHSNKNVDNNGMGAYYGLRAQGYDKDNVDGKASVRNRMFAQERGSSTADGVRKGMENWAADIDTTSSHGDITDDMPGIVGMSGAYNGNIANRDSRNGEYLTASSLEEAVSRAIRKYLK